MSEKVINLSFENIANAKKIFIYDLEKSEKIASLMIDNGYSNIEILCFCLTKYRKEFSIEFIKEKIESIIIGDDGYEEEFEKLFLEDFDIISLEFCSNVRKSKVDSEYISKLIWDIFQNKIILKLSMVNNLFEKGGLEYALHRKQHEYNRFDV